MKKRWILLNPGPVNVTARVRRALAGPDICHREPEFSALMQGVRRKLVTLFGARQTHSVALFTGSGTSALEAMLSSFAEPGEKTLVLSNGVYGERMRRMLEAHGVPVRVMESPAGEFPVLKTVEQAFHADPAITSVAMVHHETSTGMLNPAADVARLCRMSGKKILLDAVSSLGAESLDIRSFDYVAGTSGKCLHGFPGISFVFVSKKEAERAGLKQPRTVSLDLWNALALEERGDTPFTPAVQVLYAFDAALDELKSEGVAARIRSYARKSALFEKGFEDLGIRFLIPKPFRSHVLTALWTPDGISYERLHDALKHRGFIIYAGQSKLSGKIFRVSNLGAVTEKDIRRFLNELSKLLR
jgi:2-aminoethylphosphonate-pyruvate transaminase